jgi:hypothetical protein
MPSGSRLVLVGMALLLWLAAGSARAQLEIGGSLTAASAYAWRGLYVSNRPVLQPSTYLSTGLGPATVTASLYASVEIARYDARSAISEGGGAHGFDLAEWDPSLEVAFPLGDAELAFGATGFFYPNRDGLTHDDNSAEVYATLGLPLFLSPTFGVWRDVDEIAGTYLELGISHEFAIDESMSVVLSSAAGWSHNQAEDLDAAGNVRRPGNFADDGFTHWEAGVALPMALRGLQVEPSAHLIFGRDDWVRLASATRERDVKFWFGVTVSGARTLRRF